MNSLDAHDVRSELVFEPCDVQSWQYTRVDELDFYPCLVDGAPASIYVNLRYETQTAPDADTRYTVAVPIRDVGTHGIGTAEEGELLNAWEEQMIASVRGFGLVYVGRVRNRGVWEVVFYGPAGQLEAVRAAAALDDRANDLRTAFDPSWTYYRDLLLPDAERKQWMDDRRLVQILREQGDVLVSPRQVDHHLRFDTDKHRAAFVALVEVEGFTVQPSEGLAVLVSRTDSIELDHIHEVVMRLVDHASGLGGHYERWVSPIIGA